MSLKENRIIKDLETNSLVELKKGIQELLGEELPITIDWKSISSEKYLHLYKEGLENVYFSPLKQTLTSITQDELGKQALSDMISSKQLKEIIMRNTIKTTVPKNGISFNSGALIIDLEPFANHSQKEINARAEGIYKALNL